LDARRPAAKHDIRPLQGVVGVSNQATIRPRVNMANLRDEITHALHRSWFFDPEAVHVRANGEKGVLSGTVHSYHERQVAAEIAWSAPGATMVENDIAVV
jgi:osmotically-inducible protein OsmY